MFLRIEPGMHTAAINRIGVDAACTLMVTGSHDKTARLWALPEGGRGEARSVAHAARAHRRGRWRARSYAVALSPDGKWVAAGGWDAQWQTKGRSVSTSSKPPRAGSSPASAASAMSSTHLAFSPDGGRLAATLGGGEGMRLWETRKLAASRRRQGLWRQDSYGAAFDGANRLFTVAYGRADPPLWRGWAA